MTPRRSHHGLAGRFVVALLLLVAGAGHANVIERNDVIRYPVRVLPSQTLLQALNAASPIRENGQVFHGHTKWWVTWNYRWYRQASGRCAITSVTTEMHSEIQLPDLIEASDADRQRFERFLPRLVAHEQGHREHGHLAALEIDRRIAQLPEMSSCTLLEATANQTGRQVLDDYAAQDRQYDAETQHGKTQGAWLGP